MDSPAEFSLMRTRRASGSGAEINAVMNSSLIMPDLQPVDCDLLNLEVKEQVVDAGRDIPKGKLSLGIQFGGLQQPSRSALQTGKPEGCVRTHHLPCQVIFSA